MDSAGIEMWRGGLYTCFCMSIRYDTGEEKNLLRYLLVLRKADKHFFPVGEIYSHNKKPPWQMFFFFMKACEGKNLEKIES